MQNFLVAVISCIAAVSVAQTNLVQNPDLGYWTNGVMGPVGWENTSGVGGTGYGIFIHGTVSQRVPTQAGQWYHLSYLYSGLPRETIPRTFDVYWESNRIGSTTWFPGGPAVYAQADFRVFASNTPSLLLFSNILAADQPMVLKFVSVILVTNSPPVADAGSDQLIECDGNFTPVTLDGSASSDPDQGTLGYDWFLGTTLLGSGPVLSTTLPFGTNLVRLVVTDNQGASSEDVVTITIQDHTPPVFLRIETSPTDLWPPNGKMVPVKVLAIVEDACAAMTDVRIVYVLSNGSRANEDIRITSPMTLELRAEREPRGKERRYVVGVEATDEFGNKAIASVTVGVGKARVR